MSGIRFEVDTRRSLWGWKVLALGLYAGLVGLSVLWLGDWGGPHGRTVFVDLALAQRYTAALCVAASLTLWLVRERLFLALVRFQAHWAGSNAQRWRALTLGAMILVVALFGLAWLHTHKWLREGASSELMRPLLCLGLAWCLYRWQHARLGLGQQLMLAVMFVLVLLAGLLVTKDKGPMLVLAWASLLLLAGLCRQTVAGRWGSVLSLGLTSAGSAGLLLLLPHLAPDGRVAAWVNPFAARQEYLAEITWFLQAAGFWGFGRGHTPWCGYMGEVVGNCLGLSKQAQSDYVLVALAGWSGTPLAVAVVAATSLWLLSLLRLAAAAARPRHGVDVAGLAASAGALYALLLLAQLWVTCLGSVGLIPLTGVNFPLLAWARVALLNSTLVLALVWPAARRHDVHTATAVPEMGGLWLATAWVAARMALLGVMVVAAGLWWRLHYPAPEVTAAHRLDAPPTAAAALRTNPWLPVPGCVRLADGQPAAALPLPQGWQAALCQQAFQQVPQPAPATVPLPEDAPLRQAVLGLARSQPLRPFAPDPGALPIPRRQDVVLTLDAAAQQQAQQLADCLTARNPAACPSALSPELAARYAQRAEGAAARMVALVTLRLRDGALLAAAQARSVCSQAQMANTQPRPAHCLPEAAKPLRREGRLAFQPLRADDMVASTLKPLLAAALLQGPQGSRWLTGSGREALLRALAHSDTPWFIDRLLCFADSPESPEHCTRPAVLARLIQTLALDQPLDLLAGRSGGANMPLRLTGVPMPLGTWPPAAGHKAELALQAALRCQATQPRDQRWRGCDTDALQAVLAPLWGQGGARSHPMGVAGVYLRLVAAAQGQAQAPQPHLLAVSEAALPQQPVVFDPTHARLILEGLRLAPLQGTASSACHNVYGPAGCSGLGWAMKTGTSLFPHYPLTVQARAALCAQVHQALAAANGDAGPETRRQEVNCALYPMKWAVLAEDPATPDARLTVILTERNWDARTGRLDAGDDQAANVAAEATLLLHAGRAVRLVTAR